LRIAHFEWIRACDFKKLGKTDSALLSFIQSNSYYEKNTQTLPSSEASLTRYREHVQLKGLADRTVRSYELMLQKLARWAPGKWLDFWV
jgi:hypothetical protein